MTAPGAGHAQFPQDKPLIQAEELHLWMYQSWSQAWARLLGFLVVERLAASRAGVRIQRTKGPRSDLPYGGVRRIWLNSQAQCL
jgi:hypothetical protein